MESQLTITMSCWYCRAEAVPFVAEEQAKTSLLPTTTMLLVKCGVCSTLNAITPSVASVIALNDSEELPTT